MKTEQNGAPRIPEQYRMGRRLDALLYLAAAAVLVISFAFYFIYDFLFASVFPWLMGLPLALIFLGTDLALILAARLAVRKVRAEVFYRLTPGALEYTVFGRTSKYPWSSFSAARLGRVSPGAVCPVSFTVRGRELRLNPYTEQVWSLAREILDRIGPGAQIEPGLREKADAMSGL